MQKRFESSVNKQLRRSQPTLGENQVFEVTGAVDLVTTVESQEDHRAVVDMAVVVGVAKTAARAAEVSGVGELAAAAVAPRPRSPGKGVLGVEEQPILRP